MNKTSIWTTQYAFDNICPFIYIETNDRFLLFILSPLVVVLVHFNSNEQKKITSNEID